MRGFLVRWVIGALALWIASAIVPGMEIHGAGNFLLAALLLGLVNAIVRPIVLHQEVNSDAGLAGDLRVELDEELAEIARPVADVAAPEHRAGGHVQGG